MKKEKEYIVTIITKKYKQDVQVKAKNKKEADNLFKKIMGKINDTTDNVDSMIKIVGWATTIYNMVLPLLP